MFISPRGPPRTRQTPSDLNQVTALTLKKPVYIEVACNIAEESVSLPIPFQLPPRKPSNKASLRAALDTTLEMWNAAAKPVIVVGVKVCARSVRAWKATQSLLRRGLTD